MAFIKKIKAESAKLSRRGVKFCSLGAGEIAQRLRKVAILPEDPGSILSNYMVVHTMHIKIN